MTTLKIYKLYPDVKIPQHQTEQSACFDLSFHGVVGTPICGFTAMNKPIERFVTFPKHTLSIAPGDRIAVPTGMIIDIPDGYSVRVHARSGLSLKQGLVLANAEGVIDADYVNELMVLIHNISQNTVTITNGDRIAQAELIKSEKYKVEETPVRPIIKSSRVGGMGSTGVSIESDASVIKITVAEPNQPVKRGRGRPKKNV